MIGGSLSEARRLLRLAEILSSITRRILIIAAGIQWGLRTLNAGTGSGDVGFLVTDMVAAEG
jgi:hypothetical protein